MGLGLLLHFSLTASYSLRSYFECHRHLVDMGLKDVHWRIIIILLRLTSSFSISMGFETVLLLPLRSVQCINLIGSNQSHICLHSLLPAFLRTSRGRLLVTSSSRILPSGSSPSLDMAKPLQPSSCQQHIQRFHSASLRQLPTPETVLPGYTSYIPQHSSVTACQDTRNSLRHWPAFRAIQQHRSNTRMIDSGTIFQIFSCTLLFISRLEIFLHLYHAAETLTLTARSTPPSESRRSQR